MEKAFDWIEFRDWLRALPHERRKRVIDDCLRHIERKRKELEKKAG